MGLPAAGTKAGAAGTAEGAAGAGAGDAGARSGAAPGPSTGGGGLQQLQSQKTFSQDSGS